MQETEYASGPLDTLIADFRVSRKRVLRYLAEDFEDADIKDSLRYVINEIANNIYPSFIAEAEHIADVDDVIQEVIEQQQSFVHPELAAQIFHTIAIAVSLIEEIKKVAPGFDDLARKKFVDLIAAFEQSAELSVMGITDATPDESESDDEDGDEDKNEEPEPPVAS